MPGRLISEDIIEVGERLNVVKLARFDDTVDTVVEGLSTSSSRINTHE